MLCAEFCEKTGATQKQLHHWVRAGFPLTVNEPAKTDRFREYDPKTIVKVRTLVKISKAFGGYFSLDTLKIVFDHHDEGYYVFDGGVVLEWSLRV